MAEKKKLRIKFFISLKDDLQALEAKMQAWLDSTEEEEDVKNIIPVSIGNVALIIVLYK